MSKNHNNALCRGEFGVPSLFDFFSRPLSAFSGFDMENEGFKADVEDKGDRYQVKAEMPGVKKEDIKLSFDDADPSDISAAFANGELDVCLKKVPQKQPTAIKIN